jgi:hypothetical protein
MIQPIFLTPAINLLDAPAESGCSAPEAQGMPEEYAVAICELRALLEMRFFSAAIARGETIEKMRFADVPNFAHWTLYSQALRMSGNTEEAKKWLRRSRLALEVWTGTLACPPGENDPFLLRKKEAPRKAPTLHLL